MKNKFSLILLLTLFSHNAIAENWLYTIKIGDNIWNLSERYLINFSHVQELQSINAIVDPWHLKPGSTLKIPTKWLKKLPTIARVRMLQGNASISNELGVTSPAHIKSILIAGDTITTADNSTLIVEFIDGSQLSLQANSHLTINHLGLYENTGMTTTQMDLQKGRLETKVAPKEGNASQFNISTPTTITSVRGTDYRISATEDTSKTEVLEGRVGVQGHDKKQIVSGGFGLLSYQQKATPAPVKLAPAPETSVIPDLFEQNPIQFLSPKTVNIQGHRIQIAEDSDFNSVLFDKAFHNQTIRGPVELDDGLYFLRIRSIDQYGLEGRHAQTRFILNAQPEAPFLITPKPGSGVLEENPEFKWAKRENIKTYHFQLAENEQFDPVLIDLKQYDDNQLTIDTALPLGKFYWRVAVIDEHEGAGPFSDNQMFRRILPGPQAEAPEIGEENIIIQFRAGLPGQTYHFQLAEDEEFKQVLFDRHAEQPRFEIAKPSSGTYYIRAQSIDPDGYTGPFGAAQSIDIPISKLYWWLLALPLLALIAI